MYPKKRTDKRVREDTRPGFVQETRWQYCRCCGYGTLHYVSSYHYCPVCLWRDDPESEFDPFVFTVHNKTPLVIATYNYERYGYCDSEFKDKVIKPDGFERDPDFLPVREFIKNEWWYFLGSLFQEASREHHEMLDLFMDMFVYESLEATKNIFEKILSSRSYDYLWERTGVLYFDIFKENANMSLPKGRA